jgi:hypothetical protein
MRKARSLFVALLLLTGFIAGLQGRANAQGSTANATTIYDSSGADVATVSIDSIQDPFEAYDSGYEPQRGFRYVLLTITIENTGDAVFSPQPYGFTVVDNDGFVADQSYLSYDPQATDLPEQLPDAELAAGDSVTGTLAFQLLSDADISAIVYAPSYDRSYILAADIPATQAGAPVTLLGEDGGEVGTLTVDEVSDPLTDIDPSYAAPRGYHYVGVSVTLENTGNRPLTADPSRLSIIDTEGFNNAYAGVYRTTEATDAEPDLEYTDLAPGDSISGIVSFSIFNDSAPAFLVYTDGYTQFSVVMTFDGAPAIQSISDIPTEASSAPSTPVAVETPGADETAAADETPTETANLSPECQDLQVWSQELNTAIETLNDDATSIDDVSDLEAMTPDEINAQIDLLDNFLDDIDAIDTPEAAEDTYDAIVDMINVQIDGFDTVLDAKANGDDLQPIYDDFKSQVDDASETFYTAAAELDTMCPGLG